MSKNIAHNKFSVKNTKKYGKGVFTEQDISKGTVIHVLNGKIKTLKQIVESVLQGNEAMNDPLQVGRKTYIDLDEFSRSINHSCNPNCGLRKRSELFALRDISKGEEITYDYSSTIAPTKWDMNCHCGSKNCRKIIHDIRSIPKDQLNFYIQSGAIQKYLKPLLNSITKKTYIIPKYEAAALKKLGYK